tara:strand:+ start:190920 stop:192413 length:1494 start_codon:yes stop_codon:yes gene_type:complete
MGCSQKKVVEPKTVDAKAVWFKGPKKYSHVEKDGSFPVHPFFDLVPYKSKEDRGLSYVLVTPQGSQYGYDFDLVSGKKYRRFDYCEHDDIWERSDESIDKPPFHVGVVPRMLDQLREPQQILVFSDSKFIVEENSSELSQRAIVVGGFVVQYCRDYPCKSQEHWLTKLVFVGVNPYDPVFGKIKTMNQLKKKTNWSYVRAFLENGFGRSVTGPKHEPSYRVISEIEGSQAFRYGNKSAEVFTFDQLNKIRSSCFQLYDYIWNSIEEVRKNQTKAKLATSENRTKKAIQKINDLKRYGVSRFQNMNFSSKKDAVNEAKEEKRVSDFSYFFNEFYANHGNRYRTCTKFVRPASINQNKERFWFFAYLTNFFNLEDLGQYYLCYKKTWVENPRLSNGKRRYKLGGKRNCLLEQIDNAFESGITIMTGLHNSSREHYRFVDYDNGIGGSHEKLYSWVYSNGKELGCKSKRFRNDSRSVFPSDVTWKSFSTDFRKTRFDIIR